MNKKIPVIIDCDPGVDDALALMLANSKKELDIKAITTVAGNVGIEYTTKNARLVAGLLGMDTIIARGAEKPLLVPQIVASSTHGEDGFGGIGELFNEDDLAKLSEKNAVETIAKILRESEEKIIIIAVGPLTNIATVFLIYPELKEKVEVLSIMGGSTTVGNRTAKGEFNFLVDPHAAHIVMNLGLPVILAGLNVTIKDAYITDEDVEKMRKINTRVSNVATEILVAYKSEDPALHDPVSVLAITNPEIMEMEDMYVNVETSGLFSEGMTFTDERSHRKPPNNCKVIVNINRKRFIDELISAF
jgi:pyrimidine-specific ribonucleoside hydrolase